MSPKSARFCATNWRGFARRHRVARLEDRAQPEDAPYIEWLRERYFSSVESAILDPLTCGMKPAST